MKLSKAQEVAEYLYYLMPTRELVDSYGEVEGDVGCSWDTMLRRCRLRLAQEVESWSPEKIEQHWKQIQGEYDND
jgi:hypothetical protein